MSVTMDRETTRNKVGPIDARRVITYREDLAELVLRIEAAGLSDPRYRCELVGLVLCVRRMVDRGIVRNFGGFLIGLLTEGDWEWRVTDHYFDRADNVLTLCEREGLLASYECDELDADEDPRLFD